MTFTCRTHSDILTNLHCGSLTSDVVAMGLAGILAMAVIAIYRPFSR